MKLPVPCDDELLCKLIRASVEKSDINTALRLSQKVTQPEFPICRTCSIGLFPGLNGSVSSCSGRKLIIKCDRCGDIPNAGAQTGLARDPERIEAKRKASAKRMRMSHAKELSIVQEKSNPKMKVVEALRDSKTPKRTSSAGVKTPLGKASAAKGSIQSSSPLLIRETVSRDVQPTLSLLEQAEQKAREAKKQKKREAKTPSAPNEPTPTKPVSSLGNIAKLLNL